jgi:arylsulfatase A-like enzyme
MKRLLIALLLLSSFAAGAPRPNIIVILADDMGFSDLGCYGGEIQTPNLDKLAAEGMRFSQFYNCALCGPSRAALMTGLHPHQVGMTQWTGLLTNNCVTMFEVLKRADYTTCAVGRLDMLTAEDWHEPQNLSHHVDRYFGTTGHNGPGNYFANTRNTAFYRDGKPYTIPEGGYKTDLITDFTIEFLQQRDKSKPFLLYMAHYAPHWPLHAKEADIAKYRKLYRELGWDAAREQRLKRLIEKGILPADTKLSPRESRRSRMERSGASRLGSGAHGRLCRADRLPRSKRGPRDGGRARHQHARLLPQRQRRVRQSRRPARQAGPNMAQPMANAPAWATSPTSCPARATPSSPPVPPGPLCPIRPSASTSSRIYEGGISSPLIAWWPGVVKAGKISPELSHITDITATVFDVAGQYYPEAFDNRA